MTYQPDLFTPAPKRSYFNTTSAPAETVAKRNKKASGQNDLIFAFMIERQAEDFTAWELSRHFLKMPITSIRRALNTLEREDIIFRTGQRAGDYGVENNTYKVKPTYF